MKRLKIVLALSVLSVVALVLLISFSGVTRPLLYRQGILVADYDGMIDQSPAALKARYGSPQDITHPPFGGETWHYDYHPQPSFRVHFNEQRQVDFVAGGEPFRYVGHEESVPDYDIGLLKKRPLKQ